MLNSDIKRRIDAARDILVGKVPDPKAQVEQITTALIYKFMDDMDKESEELGGEASFFVDGYQQYAWSKLLNPRLGGFERLSLYAEALTKMHQNSHLPQLFRDIFKDAFLPYRDPETLNLFLKEINGFTYDHSENLGNAFEYLLSVMDSQGDAGQFRTPRHIIDFIVKVVDPTKEDTILDPACGTAGFLISAYKHILQQNSVKRPGDQLTPDERTRLMRHFVGYDISPDMVRLSLVNMYLHGFPNPNIHEYDTLTSEEHWDEHYDVIMANPPFMTPKGGIRPHKRFSIQASRSEVLFVDYIAEHLTIHGRAGVIVPEGIIFQSGSAYKALRKMLVEKYVWAIVSLPGGVFQPYSGVKTSILLMDKTLAKKAKSILFVKAENDGFDLGAQRRPIDKNDLPLALAIFQQYKQALQNGEDPGTILKDNVVSSMVVIAEKSLIAKNGDYNLSGERYKEIHIRLHQDWPMIELEEVFTEIKNGKNVSQIDEIGKYRVTRIQTIADGVVNLEKTKWTIDEVSSDDFMQHGDILLSHINSYEHLAKSAIFPNISEKVVHGVNLIRLRPNTQKINPYFASYIFKSAPFTEKAKTFAQKAVNQASIKSSDLKSIQIPLPPLEVQQEIVAELDSYQKIIDGAKQVVESYKPAIKIDPSWETVRLGDICEFRNGINYTKDSAGERIKILGVKDFQDNFYAPIEDLDYVIADGNLNDNDLLKEGNIVFVRSNGNQNLIGRCLLVGKVEERITHSGFTIRLKLKTRELNPVFLTHLLKLDAFRQRMIEGGTGANIKSLNQGILSNLIIPVPPIETQKRLVSQIEEEQKLVEANKKLIEIFEHKIRDKIAEVWGELEVSEDEVRMPPQIGTFNQAQRVRQVEIEQAELGFA